MHDDENRHNVDIMDIARRPAEHGARSVVALLDQRQRPIQVRFALRERDAAIGIGKQRVDPKTSIAAIDATIALAARQHPKADIEDQRDVAETFKNHHRLGSRQCGLAAPTSEPSR